MTAAIKSVGGIALVMMPEQIDSLLAGLNSTTLDKHNHLQEELYVFISFSIYYSGQALIKAQSSGLVSWA